MSSKIATVADAVVAHLNDPARAYSMPFTASRRYVPRFTEAALEALTVSVSGVNRRRSVITRGTFQKTIVVNVGVLRRLAQASDPSAAGGLAELDGLMALAEEIEDSFRAGEFGGASLDPAETTLAFDPAQLATDKVFFSVVSLSFYYIE